MSHLSFPATTFDHPLSALTIPSESKSTHASLPTPPLSDLALAGLSLARSGLEAGVARSLATAADRGDLDRAIALRLPQLFSQGSAFPEIIAAVFCRIEEACAPHQVPPEEFYILLNTLPSIAGELLFTVQTFPEWLQSNPEKWPHGLADHLGGHDKLSDLLLTFTTQVAGFVDTFADRDLNPTQRDIVLSLVNPTLAKIDHQQEQAQRVVQRLRSSEVAKRRNKRQQLSLSPSPKVPEV